MIPVLGFVVWGVLLPLGLGAALLAAFEGFKKSRPTDATGASQAGPIFVPSRPQSAAASAFTPGPTASSAEMPPSTPPPFPATLPPPDCISMPRVGFWLRLAATALDFILLVWLLSASGPLFLAAWLAYHVGMWTWKGTTIGGIVCSIKVVRLDGRPPDFSVALVRGLASVFSAVAAGMGFFWAGWSHEKQSWHDKIAGTVIVKVPRGVSPDLSLRGNAPLRRHIAFFPPRSAARMTCFLAGCCHDVVVPRLRGYSPCRKGPSEKPQTVRWETCNISSDLPLRTVYEEIRPGTGGWSV